MSLVPALAEAHAARIERLKRMGGFQQPPAVVIPSATRRQPAVPIVANSCRQQLGNGFAWTDAEVDVLLDMSREKFSARAIGTKLRRSAGSVQSKARSLGIVLYMRPSRDFGMTFRGEEITKLYKLVVNLDKSSNVRVREIIALCAARHDLTPEGILSDGRAEVLVAARQQAMWLAAKETKLSLPALGKLFGRDHTTILHGIRRENTRTGENVRGLGGRKR